MPENDEMNVQDAVDRIDELNLPDEEPDVLDNDMSESAGQSSDPPTSDDDDDLGDAGDQAANGSKGIGGTVAGAVAAVAVLVFAAISNLTVGFDRLDVLGKTIEYGISVSMDYDVSADPNVDWNHADTGLVLVVSNSKEVYTRPLVTADAGTEVSVKPKSEAEDNHVYQVDLQFNGVIEGLTEHRPYKVSVIGDDNGETKVYCEKNVNTSGPLTEIRGIEGHCSCTVDGKYHFKLKYTDDGNYYQSFAYRLLDPSGNVVAAAEIANPREEQEILHVDQLKGKQFVLEITVTSVKPADQEADHFSKKLGKGTELHVHQGAVTLTQDIEL